MPANDHGAVMQRRVGFKDIFKQRCGDFAVQLRAGFKYVFQSCAAFEYDQRANTAAGEVQKALGDFVDDTGVFIGIAVEMVNPRTTADLFKNFAISIMLF